MTDKLENEGTIELTGINADWMFSTNVNKETGGIASIMFIPGSTSDVLVVRDGSASMPTIFECDYTVGQAVTPPHIKYFFGAAKDPFISFSECSLATGHKVIIEEWPGKSATLRI